MPRVSDPHVPAEAVESSSEAEEPGVLCEEFNRIGHMEEQQFEGPIPAYLVGKVCPIGPSTSVAGLSCGGHRRTFLRKAHEGCLKASLNAIGTVGSSAPLAQSVSTAGKV